MAEFHANTIAYATDFEDASVNAPSCFKCKKGQVEAHIAPDDAIDWSCPRCKTQGRISNWQDTLWDLTDQGENHN